MNDEPPQEQSLKTELTGCETYLPVAVLAATLRMQLIVKDAYV